MTEELENQLVKHIDEAYAMEQSVLRLLDSMISTTEDPAIKDQLREHRLETEKQSDRMLRQLEAHGASPSKVREGVGMVQALMKSVLDATAPRRRVGNARDGYATEHLEIAAYEAPLADRRARRRRGDGAGRAREPRGRGRDGEEDRGELGPVRRAVAAGGRG